MLKGMSVQIKACWYLHSKVKSIQENKERIYILANNMSYVFYL